jgi:hypothetical protein
VREGQATSTGKWSDGETAVCPKAGEVACLVSILAHRTAPHGTAPHRTTLHCTALYCTARHSTKQAERAAEQSGAACVPGQEALGLGHRLHGRVFRHQSGGAGKLQAKALLKIGNCFYFPLFPSLLTRD